MADELEKFVLQYTADTKDTIERLEQLDSKVDKISKGAKAGGVALKGLGSDGMNALGMLIPGFNRFNTVFNMTTRGLVTATAGAGAFLVVLKSVYDLQQQYEAQRLTGWNVGQSPIGIEQYQRQLNKSSGGVMQGEGARTLLEKISSMSQSAFTQVNPNNMDALKLRTAGTSGYGADGKLRSLSSTLDDMTTKFQSVSKEQADAIGKSIGFTQDEVQAIRGRTAAVITSTKMTDEQVKKTNEANATMESLRNSYGSASEATRMLATSIGQFFAPMIADLSVYLVRATTEIRGILESASSFFDEHAIGRAVVKGNDFYDQFWQVFSGRAKNHKDLSNFGDELTGSVNKVEAERKKVSENNAMNAKSQADAALLQLQNAAQFTKNMNLFASSVGAFATSVDDRTAWAAWAGAAGQAGGLKGMGLGLPNGSPARGTPAATLGGLPIAGSSAYNFGNIRATPDSFRTYGSAEEGMSAQAKQLMRYYDGSTTGKPLTNIKDIISTWAPASDKNDTSEYIKYMSDKMGLKPGDKIDFNNKEVLGKFMYYQAMKEKGANKIEGAYTQQQFTDAANGKGAPAAQAGGSYGYNRQSFQAKDIQNQVANLIGISPGQLNSGQVSRGDVDFAVGKMRFDTENNIKALQAKMSSGQMLGREAAMVPRQLMLAKQFLDNINAYGPGIVGRNNGDPERKLTGDMPDPTMRYPINIYVNGVSDPKLAAQQTAIEVGRVVNGSNTAVVK